MDRHVANAMRVAEVLASDPRVAWVNYPGLGSGPQASRYHDLARRYLPRGAGGILAFGLVPGRDGDAQRAGERFIEAARFMSHLANVGDARTLVIHPASTTHRQLDAVQQQAAGVTPDMVRLSVGIESVDDISGTSTRRWRPAAERRSQPHGRTTPEGTTRADGATMSMVAHPPPVPARAARRAGLVYVTDAEPGIVRMSNGAGFVYRTRKGIKVSDPRILDRIRLLAIPPAYTDVWICRDRARAPAGHRPRCARSQAVPLSPAMDALRDDGKFDRLVAFGRALPRLRRRLRARPVAPGFPARKSPGDRHLRCWPTPIRSATTSTRAATARYRSDDAARPTVDSARRTGRGSGSRARVARRTISCSTTSASSELVRGCQQLPGQTLFQYRDDRGRLQPLGSTMVNAYLQP